MRVYAITIGDGPSTEELVAAANYGYCRSQVMFDNFPAKPFNGRTSGAILLLSFDHPVSSEEATSAAAEQGLEPHISEHALYFGIGRPEVQVEGPVAFPHDLSLVNHRRRDAICLWSYSGWGELGLEGFEDFWASNDRLAFVRGARRGAPIRRD